MMKLLAPKLLATVICVSSVWGASAAPAEAFIFPWCWGGCGPCGGNSCGYRSYYGPVSYGGCSTCGPTCSPCGSSCGPCASVCAPCGGYCSTGNCASGNCASGNCASGNCASGDCALGSASPMTPAPDNGWQKKTPKTYAPSEGTGGTGDATLGDPATIDRTSPDSGFDRTKRSGNPLDEKDSVEAFKLPLDAAANAGEAIPVQPRQGSRPGPAVQAIPEEKGISAPLLPTVSLDDKIAWRAAPERKRLTIDKSVGNARLVRLPAYPRSEWIPVDSESKIAKK